MKRCIPLLVFLLISGSCMAQLEGRPRLDSLLMELRSPKDDRARIDLLKELSGGYSRFNPDSGLIFAYEIMELARQLRDTVGVFEAHRYLGMNYSYRSDHKKAIDHYEKALAIDHPYQKRQQAGMLVNLMISHLNSSSYILALRTGLNALEKCEEIDNPYCIAAARGNLGLVYEELGEYEKSLACHQRNLSFYREMHRRESEARALGNIGRVYAAMKRYEEALDHDLEALRLFEEIEQPHGIAVNLTNIGAVHLELGDLAEAYRYYQRALPVCRELGEAQLTGNSLAGLGEVYFKSIGATARAGQTLLDKPEDRRLTLAQEHLEEAFDILEASNDLRTAQRTAILLSELYEKLGRSGDALRSQRAAAALKDSIKIDEARTELMKHEHAKQMLTDSLAFAAEKEIKELEIREQQANLNKQRIALFGSLGGLALIILLALAIYKGKKRSDDLLLNILPYETAQELKSKGHSEARQIDHVTVLFTDFKGFTELADGLSPQELVEEINACFSAFDNIMEKHGVEKIKTIGDAYMAAGGMPTPKATHALDTVMAALDIQRFMLQRAEINKLQGRPFFEVRIGIHTGPVVAGIVGIKKYQYDIWGDTVNVASRMENHSEPGKINISEITYELVKDHFTFSQRGETEVKGKGRLAMYFVEGCCAEMISNAPFFKKHTAVN